MNSTSPNIPLSIPDLPEVLTSLFERAQHPLLSESQSPPALFMRYLRRKPGRGLTVIYVVDEASSSYKAHTHNLNRFVSLTLDEHVLDGSSIRFSAAQAQQAPLEIQPSGVLHAPDLGLFVQVFPADGNLPSLAICCDMAPQSPLFEALQLAAQLQLCDPGWCLIEATAEPVRYKPANRCVIRYHLHLERLLQQQQTTEASSRRLTLFGKVYADPEAAPRVYSLQQQLYEEVAKTGDIPLLPRPLGMIKTLGLILSEAVQLSPSQENKPFADELRATLRTGTRALQPQFERGRGGAITKVGIPYQELRLTAQALACLHNSRVHLTQDTLRTGAKEAKRAKERASLIAGHYSALAEEVLQLAQQLASRLEALQPETYCPAHGGFKPSQLLFHSEHVFMVDFDGFCLADPALDVGYFLAYLRPSGLWYRRPGMRQWFEVAAETFRSMYRQAMVEHGVAHPTVNGILDRSQVYEAALLLKIATRRVNRLNSPRPQELASMLDEIAICLT